MSAFYHCSDEAYTPSQTLNSIYGEGKYGQRFMKAFYGYDIEKCIDSSFMWEMIFEWVRKREFPTHVSRLCCLFSVDNLSDVDKWKGVMSSETCYSIYRANQ